MTKMNFSKIEDLAGDSTDFIIEMLESYIESLQEFEQNFKQVISDLDKDKFQKVTHKIKASLRFLEMRDIENSISVCKEEIESENPNQEVLNREIQKVHKLCQDFEKQLDTQLRLYRS